MRRDLLVLTPDFPPSEGGIQTLMHRLSSSFERYRPRVVTLGDGCEEDWDRTQSFPVHRVRRPGLTRSARVGALNLKAVEQALRQRPSAVLSGHVVTGPGAIAVKRLLGIPVVQYVHADELNRRPTLAREILRRADTTIAVSEYGRSLVQAFGVQPTRVRVVHPGVDRLPETGVHRNGSRSVVVISRLQERYKGHDVLLRALPLVRSRVPEVHLDVIGDGVLREHLAARAHGLGLDGAVTFHGRVSDDRRDAIMRRSSVFAMLSRLDALGSGEGFGIVYTEAGRLGIPVVAGRVGGALDAVVDGETGLLVDPEDHVEAADAITSLLTDPALAERLGNAGREHARALTWQRAACGVEDVLDRVVG